MNSKKLSKTLKESPSRDNNKRNDIDVPDERTRIIQKNLVFANGIPNELHHKQILKQNIYFGRYGKVTKIITNSTQGNRKLNNCHAYVTYENQLQASLAIVALDGFNYNQRPLKVSYGTTKYCSNFVRGYECKNTECFYLHKVNKKMEVQNEESRNIFKDQNDKAFNIVSQNIEYVVEKMMSEEENEDGFPTYSEMVDFLIESNFVNKSQIESIKKSFSTPSKLTTIESTPPLTKKRSQSLQEQKLTKSNSFSTVCTPSKYIVVQENRKIVREQRQKGVVKKQQKKIESPKIVKQQNESKEGYKLEQKIEKMLIRSFFRKNNQQIKSKLNFVNSQGNSIEELGKLKNIIQRHLIAKK